MIDMETLLEKYTAWAKHSDKYTAKQVLNQIVADLMNLEAQPSGRVSERVNFQEKARKCLHEMNVMDQFIDIYHPNSDVLIEYSLSEVMAKFGKWLQSLQPKEQREEMKDKAYKHLVDSGIFKEMYQGDQEIVMKAVRIAAGLSLVPEEKEE